MILEALFSLRPNAKWCWVGTDYNDIEWFDEEQTKPTLEELQVEAQRLLDQIPLNACREKAKALLQDTDWSQLADVGLLNKAEFDAYRAAVRALVLNPVANPTFPNQPIGQWS